MADAGFGLSIIVCLSITTLKFLEKIFVSRFKNLGILSTRIELPSTAERLHLDLRNIN